MTVETRTGSPFVLGPDAVPAAQQEAARGGAAVAPAETCIVAMTGPAVMDCIQGLLTNDLAAAGPSGFVYGAVLTPKGMIVCDLWVTWDGHDALLFAPAHGREALLDVLARYVPPRLARVEQRTSRYAVLRVVGPAAAERLAAMHLSVPAPGATSRGDLGRVPYVAARPSTGAPFTIQLLTDAAHGEALLALLGAGGIVRADGAVLELARILSGWPRLGAEVDRKTLPQEVRFDEIDGVSYTKGCYTGQETVARLHFRGHANRRLAGLAWEDEPELANEAVERDGKRVGCVTSVAWLAGEGRWIGLGVLRREIEPDETVTAAGRQAEVRSLPFASAG